MDKLEQLRRAETMDEDADREMDLVAEDNERKKKSFKEEYKEFYSDIKISVKEDW